MIRFPCRLFAEVVENEEEECDTDLERQNVEELYDFVRHQHQSESQEETYDVQHKALIPVLRPYQRQAVNWMLRREKFRIMSPRGRNTPSARLLLLFPARVEPFKFRASQSNTIPQRKKSPVEKQRKILCLFFAEQTLHFLWRELITLCGKKLFYNPFTGW